MGATWGGDRRPTIPTVSELRRRQAFLARVTGTIGAATCFAVAAALLILSTRGTAAIGDAIVGALAFGATIAVAIWTSKET